MNTRTLNVPITDARADHPAIVEAASAIVSGGLVAFPTETVYGLGADLFDEAAVKRIFQAKGRPADNPLIVHVASRAQLDDFVASVDPLADKLMRRFWPGPLTIVLPARPGTLPAAVTAGLSTVAVRMPDHPVALALIEAAGRPLPAPSANRSGRMSPTRAEHVLDDLAGRIELVVDGGATGIGLESTVVAVEEGTVTVLRPGGIPLARLREVLAADGVRFAYAEEMAGNASSAAPRAPGMKYKHYAPQGELHVVIGTRPEAVSARIRAMIDTARRDGRKTGVLTFEEHATWYEADLVVACGSLRDPRDTARRLYASLRRFDEHQVECIVAEAYLKPAPGAVIVPDLSSEAAVDWLRTIFNRLQKAAEYRVVEV